MRYTIIAAVLCLLALLSGAGLLAAAEPEDDEKITAPKAPPAPPVPGRIAPPEGYRRPGDSPAPTLVIPERAGPVIIVPLPPEQKDIVPHPPGTRPSDQASPVEIPVVPVLPDKTVPEEVPVIPVLPQVPDRTTAPAPPHQQETPQKESLAPYSATPAPDPPAVLEPGKQPSPMDFLPKPTLLVPDKTQQEPKAEKDKQPSAQKGKQPDKAPVEEPKTQAPSKPEAPKTQTPPQTAQTKPKPGDPLRIPPDAAKTGDLSFLEGCWRGTRPEYTSKRIITERFCFDKNGNGKRTIDDPQYAGKCTGAAKGSFDAQGRLIVTSEQGYCTGGARWGKAHMVCQGEGNSTPCFWRFPDAGGGTQSYKIPLVRE